MVWLEIFRKISPCPGTRLPPKVFWCHQILHYVLGTQSQAFLKGPSAHSLVPWSTLYSYQVAPLSGLDTRPCPRAGIQPLIHQGVKERGRQHPVSEVHPVGNGWWKWLGKRNSSRLLSPVVLLQDAVPLQTFYIDHGWANVSLVSVFVFPLWSCTQTDNGYTHNIVSFLSSFLILMTQVCLYIPNKVIIP